MPSMPMQFTDAQGAALNRLVPLGWKIGRSYNDGVLQLVRDISDERVRMWLRTDGSISAPFTSACQIARAELAMLNPRLEMRI